MSRVLLAERDNLEGASPQCLRSSQSIVTAALAAFSQKGMIVVSAGNPAQDGGASGFRH